ncbi:MAG: M24 family metallopeptidase [Sphingomonadales bacterium]|nr:M24 family metallopeptidase [Sphingomonadales bacterium]
MPAFARKEYLQRLHRVKCRMQEKGLDLLWVTSPPNMNYLSGYDGWSFYVHQGLLVSLDAEEPVWIGRHIDVNAARITSFLDEANILGYDESYITDGKHALSFVADIVRSRNLGNSRIGVEMDTHYFTAKAYAVLSEELANASFFDADHLVNWARIVKSGAEIAYLREAGAITDIAMRAAIDAIDVDVRQCDVAGIVFQNLISGHPDYFGDMPDYQTLPMGENTSAPHLTWTDERFKAGDICTLELGANRYRYHAPLARTVFVGDPPDGIKRLAAIVGEGLEAALDEIRPGVQAQSIESVWRGITRRAGLRKESRIGYSVGLGYPPDWGEGTASLAPGDTTELAENMTFHLIIGIWNDHYGYELSETFLVTETGAECLSALSRELIVKDG